MAGRMCRLRETEDRMNPRTLVVLLEEHLADIRSGLVDTLWCSFVDGLEVCSTSLAATRKALDDWTDRVVELMKKFDYTKGLLRGLAISAALGTRSLPVARQASGIDPQSGSDSRPTSEEELVVRIEGVVRRARSMA